ncbi:MAG: amino acid ABC transporter permease [Ruminococcaceae bacterium]|nr:amino acid ABC transporter permease [Oscillospiraceae bacterium]
MEAEIENKNTAIRTNPDGTTEVKEFESGNIKQGFLDCLEVRQNEKPDTASAFVRFWNKQQKTFHKNFIEAGRWKTIFKGLWTTIRLTVFALLLGIVIGFLVAFIRATYLKLTKRGIILKILNAICQVYLTVIRGTPVVVQIMIIYFVIFMPLGIDKFLAAVVCFGLNSGAYVAEIVRGGIMSVDNGQTEAGRSLGFGYMPTMFHIVFPQAFKTVLPALANEFVVLLKETSIAFYIGLGDLMYSINAIRAATYTAFMPLVASAIIYLIMVLILQHLVTLLERRLRNSER